MTAPLSCYDVAIVGAGPGGSAAAYYLARAGLKVGLIDKAVFPRDKTCGDTLTPGALHSLAEMTLLDSITEQGRRIHRISLTAPNGFTLTSPLPPKPDWPDYALGIKRFVLDRLLRNHAESAGAELISGVTITHITPTKAHTMLHGEQHGKALIFQARLAIIATGANVGFLMRLGLIKRVPRMMVATRAYYESTAPLRDTMQMYFGGIPLPGYGWLFPVSETTANVGIGLCPVGMAARWLHSKARPTFEQFVATATMQTALGAMRRNGPARGYPLRMDFASAKTIGERMLLVGEAAGLVNPLTGEGIDYALASGQMAARYVYDLFQRGDLSQGSLGGYDRILRARFQDLFVFSNWTRDLLVNRLALNLLIKLAAHHAALRMALMRIVLGYWIENSPAPSSV